jgi:hypothetical protein
MPACHESWAKPYSVSSYETLREVSIPSHLRESPRLRVWVPLALAIGALAYLMPFVDRGWMPHDEGTIGGNAVRVLAGQIPHIHFQDYSGAMTWLYAALFRVFGIDVIHFRQALLVGAIAAVLVWYCIARRFAGPAAAAAAAFVALLWSFPNYFAGLPSWWIVIFGSCTVLFLMRFAERRRLASLLVAGLFCGLACTFKQTGMYLVASAALSIVFAEQSSQPFHGRADAVHPSAWLRALAASLSAACVLLLIASKLSASTVILLAAPPLSVAAVLWLDERHRRDEGAGQRPRTLVLHLTVFTAGVLLPIAIWLIPYATRGAWGPLLQGTLGLAQNFTRVIAYETPSLWLAVGLLPLLFLLRFAAAGTSERGRRATAWIVPVVVALFFSFRLGHLMIWNAFRFGSIATILWSAYWIWRDRTHRSNKAPLFALTATAAFVGLNQFPFSAPVYFCYVAPFAVLTLFASLSSAGEPAKAFRPPLLLALAIFAALSLNRGYLDNMGYEHAVVRLDTKLDLPRASLRVSREDAEMYRRVVSLIDAHSSGDTIYAFPDCPEVYYLASKANPTPANFDLFYRLTTDQVLRIWTERDVRVIVINHRPRFSGRPAADLLQEARSRFAHTERVGLFEVRWRE